MGQYLHFNIYCPMSCKTLFLRATRRYSEDSLNSESGITHKALNDNGYSVKFIQKHLKLTNALPQQMTVLTKNVSINLPFEDVDFST